MTITPPTTPKQQIEKATSNGPAVQNKADISASFGDLLGDLLRAQSQVRTPSASAHNDAPEGFEFDPEPSGPAGNLGSIHFDPAPGGAEQSAAPIKTSMQTENSDEAVGRTRGAETGGFPITPHQQGSFLGRGIKIEKVDGTAPAPVAEMFNEYGILNNKIWLESSTVNDAMVYNPVAQATTPLHPADSLRTFETREIASLRLDVPGGAHQEPRTEWPIAEHRAAAGGRERKAHRFARAIGIEFGGTEQTHPASVFRQRPRSGNIDGKAVQTSTAHDEVRQGHAAEVQLTLEAGEVGLRLIARAQQLSREQKDRLRADIEALLSRYGLATLEVRLNGETVSGAPPAMETP